MNETPHVVNVEVPCIALFLEVDAAPRFILSGDRPTRERIIRELTPELAALLVEALAMHGIDVEYLRDDVD